MNAEKLAHLWYPEYLVESVLRGKEIKALCGFADSFTRDRFDLEWIDTCTACLKRAAEIQGADGVRFKPPETWQDLLERVYLALPEPPPKPQYQYTFSMTTTNWTGNSWADDR